jgi:tetratricopeptide (TPR) repeat protein
MRSAADASIPGQENRAWVLCNLAMLYANSGASDTAEFILRGTLEERSGYPHALAGLARLEAQAGRHDTAVALYGRAIAAMNEPAFHEALGETYEAAGRPEDAIRCYDTAESLYDAEHAAGEDNAVEMASFLALHDRRLSDALRMARDGAGRRPSVHGCQTLALALFKNGLYQEAREASRRALRLGTRDASIYELARLIAERIGDKPAAEHYRALARSLGVPVHLLRFTQSGGRPRDGAVTGG